MRIFLDPYTFTCSIQTIMMKIINDYTANEMIQKTAAASGSLVSNAVESVKMSTIILTVLPIVMVYPFLQKYFVKGIMIGSLKG